jgi:hypothetical protein
VTRLFATIDRRWRAPARAERIAAVRVLVGLFGTVYVVCRVPYILDVSRLSDARFEPVGIATVLDAPLPL